MLQEHHEKFIKTVFLIERSTGVFHTAKSYLKEGSLSFVSFQTPDGAVRSDELTACIILFGNDSLQETRYDIGGNTPTRPV